MATQVQWRGGSTAEHTTFTGAAREVTVDTQKKTLVVHDGSTAGGAPLLKENQTNLPTSVTNGIAVPSANTVAINTGGAQRLLINSSGNITAGGGVSGAGGLNISGAGWGVLPYVANSFVIDSTAGQTRLFATGTDASTHGNLLFFTGTTNGTASERLRITSAGLVGIGTSSASNKLTIYEAAANPIRLIQDHATSSAYGIEFHSQASTPYTVSSITASHGAAYVNPYLDINVADSSRVLQQRVRIDASGRVGIGTTGPINSLEVVGGATGNLFAVKASSGGDCLAVTARAAGNGAIVSALNSAQSDYEPFELNGEFIYFQTRTGAGTVSERARIDSSGRLLVGTSASTGNGGLLQAKVTSGAVAYYEINEGGFSQNAIDVANAANFGFRPFRFFVNGIGGTEVGSISCSTTATSYVTSSDYRLKENVTPVTDGITRLQQLKPSRFNFIADPGTVVDGFIAHEVQTVVPEAINGEKDAVDDDGNPIYQGIDQSKLVPLLTAALQEAVAKIESLEARLTAAGI